MFTKDGPSGPAVLLSVRIENQLLLGESFLQL